LSLWDCAENQYFRRLGGAAGTNPGKRANFLTPQMDEFSCRGKNLRALGDQMSAVRDIAVFVGSLRKESLNRKLAKALAELAPSSLKLEIAEIGQLPLYNQDFDEDPSPVYVEFRARVRAADGVLFVTPEYNRSVPGALKNALDVASRPYGQSAWNGKPGAVIIASPGAIGGFGANHHLRQSLVFLNVSAMQQPEAYIGGADKLFDASGKLANDGTRKFLQQFIEAFANWVAINTKS
jgi:chromate reductase